MSFKNLTSGERRRLQQGILSAEEATKVSIRAAEKQAQQPSLAEKVEGGVRLIGKAIATAYGAGGLVTTIEKLIPRATPEQQLGLVPFTDTGGGAPMPNGETGIFMPGPEGTVSTDWLGSLARITSAIAPAFYPSSTRRAIGPEADTGYPSAAPRALPGPAGPIMSGIVRVILYKIRQNVGRAISLSSIAALVRRLGPAATAIGLGIAVDELATLIFHHEARKARRRRRGISARDITRARSTITRMTRFMGRVQEACAPVGHVRHRRRLHRPGCGCIVCRRAA